MIQLPVNLTTSGFHDPTGNRTPISIPNVEKIREWIMVRNIAHDKSGRAYSSYRLKHIAEDDLGFYLTNGELIAAMILERFEYYPEGINARFCLQQIQILSGKKTTRRDKYQKLKENYLAK
ncbi:MAG TPA: hypothetical protein VIH86_06500 [Puia sp.]